MLLLSPGPENKFQQPEFPHLWSPHTSPLLPGQPSSPPHAYTPPTCPLCSPTEEFGFLEGVGCLSVTTKQNHLKTKWTRECAGAI